MDACQWGFSQVKKCSMRVIRKASIGKQKQGKGYDYTKGDSSKYISLDGDRELFEIQEGRLLKLTELHLG